MSIPDPQAAIIAFLLADAQVAAQAGTRVYGDEVLDSEVPSMPRKLIVVAAAGIGASVGNRSRIQLSRPRMDVFCYGATFHEAAQLDLAAYEALKQMEPHVRSSVRLHDAIPVSGPIRLREPDTHWPLRFRSYLVTAAEVAVA